MAGGILDRRRGPRHDWRQPGGWIYNILPYIEQQAMHDLGAGTSWNARKIGGSTSSECPPRWAFSIAPTRRKVYCYPGWRLAVQINCGWGTPRGVGRSDYSGNSRQQLHLCRLLSDQHRIRFQATLGWYASGPPSIAAVENPPGTMTPGAHALDGQCRRGRQRHLLLRQHDSSAGCDGRMCSNTFSAGEKYVGPDC